MEEQRTMLVNLKEDFIQFEVKEPVKPIETKEEPKSQRSELYYLMINALSVITNGINHSHFKCMKQIIGEAGYDEYSFTIWRCLFIMITNYFLMKYRKEQMTPFSELCHNRWFWTRMLIQFFALQTFLLLNFYYMLLYNNKRLVEIIMEKRTEIENLIKEKLNIKDLDYSATLATYGLDSLDVVEFVLEVEDTYGVTFESEETKDLKTVGNLIDLIEKKISK